MGRRSDHSRQELHDLALDAASDLAMSGGLRAITARNIADRLGYSPGTIYNVFQNLDDLILHLNGRTLDALYDAVVVNAQSQEDPGDALRAMLVRYLTFVRNRDALWALIFEHKMPPDTQPPDWYQEKVDRLLAVLGNTLAPLFPSGNAAESAVAARLLWASLYGICSLSEDGKLPTASGETVDDLGNRLIDVFLAGLPATASLSS